MNWKAYGQYEIEDFLLDDFFVQWVLRPDEQKNKFWQQWLDSYPEKRATLMQARELLLSIHFDEEKMPVWQLEENWQLLKENYLSSIKRTDTIFGKTTTAVKHIFLGKKRTVKWGYAMAAAMALLICANYFLFSEKTYQTAYGQIKNIHLSDGSEITLAPNSTLSVGSLLSFGKRKVTLKGEALFKVKHLSDPERTFLVQSGDLKVEVLGTEFSVNNYSGISKVVLKNGKVALYPDEQKQPTYMAPGDKVIYNPENSSLQKKQVDLQKYDTWLQKNWQLNHVSLQEIINNLNYHYGIELRLANRSLATETITASISDASPQKIFKVLETVFQTPIDTLTSGIYILQAKPNQN